MSLYWLKIEFRPNCRIAKRLWMAIELLQFELIFSIDQDCKIQFLIHFYIYIYNYIHIFIYTLCRVYMKHVRLLIFHVLALCLHKNITEWVLKDRDAPKKTEEKIDDRLPENLSLLSSSLLSSPLLSSLDRDMNKLVPINSYGWNKAENPLNQYQYRHESMTETRRNCREMTAIIAL